MKSSARFQSRDDSNSLELIPTPLKQRIKEITKKQKYQVKIYEGNSHLQTLKKATITTKV